MCAAGIQGFFAVFSGFESRLPRHIRRQHRLPVDRHHRRPSWKLHPQGMRNKADLETFSNPNRILLLMCVSLPVQVTVNPDFLVPESDFSNNVVRCEVIYTGIYIQTRNCILTGEDMRFYLLHRINISRVCDQSNNPLHVFLLFCFHRM